MLKKNTQGEMKSECRAVREREKKRRAQLLKVAICRIGLGGEENEEIG